MENYRPEKRAREKNPQSPSPLFTKAMQALAAIAVLRAEPVRATESTEPSDIAIEENYSRDRFEDQYRTLQVDFLSTLQELYQQNIPVELTADVVWTYALPAYIDQRLYEKPAFSPTVQALQKELQQTAGVATYDHSPLHATPWHALQKNVLSYLQTPVELRAEVPDSWAVPAYSAVVFYQENTAMVRIENWASGTIVYEGVALRTQESLLSAVKRDVHQFSSKKESGKTLDASVPDTFPMIHPYTHVESVTDKAVLEQRKDFFEQFSFCQVSFIPPAEYRRSDLESLALDCENMINNALHSEHMVDYLFFRLQPGKGSGEAKVYIDSFGNMIQYGDLDHSGQFSVSIRPRPPFSIDTSTNQALQVDLSPIGLNSYDSVLTQAPLPEIDNTDAGLHIYSYGEFTRPQFQWASVGEAIQQTQRLFAPSEDPIVKNILIIDSSPNASVRPEMPNTIIAAIELLQAPDVVRQSVFEHEALHSIDHHFGISQLIKKSGGMPAGDLLQIYREGIQVNNHFSFINEAHWFNFPSTIIDVGQAESSVEELLASTLHTVLDPNNIEKITQLSVADKQTYKKLLTAVNAALTALQATPGHPFHTTTPPIKDRIEQILPTL